MGSFFQDKEKATLDYFENGYHIEYGLISSDECEFIKQYASQLNSIKSGNFSPVMMPHREDSRFLSIMANEKIKEIMSAFLRGKVSGLQSQYFTSGFGTKGFTAHQDNYFVQSKNDAFASAWLALEDTRPENGGLIVYPKSHKTGLLEVRETNISNDSAQDPNAYRMEVVIPEDYQPVSLSIPQGAVLFIHGCVVHASHDNNLEGSTRKVLLNTYVRKGEPFRAGRDAKRVEIEI
ncbi:phytanoyl-CoA dioxygenase family protein [Marinomonas gallaica]|uniref:phytanoyl-CoA dioxygenase family protein n=1 Tax=Marinomonas gallaica TaxID=1806667 RepID=UPI003A8D075B